MLGEEPTEQEQADYDAALAERGAAEDMAVQVLWALSGRRFGLCDTVVRPCASGHGWPFGSPFIYTLDMGHWSNWPCGCVGRCEVSGPRVVHLPGPAAEVVEVTINGDVLAADGYQLEGDALYRTGGAVWPSQDLGRPLGESGTWSVTYKLGVPVPAGVDRLVGVLAREFLLGWAGDGECRLPRTVIATSRRGVSHQFDPARTFAAGTGLTEVDQWLAAVNPAHLASDAVVV